MKIIMAKKTYQSLIRKLSIAAAVIIGLLIVGFCAFRFKNSPANQLITENQAPTCQSLPIEEQIEINQLLEKIESHPEMLPEFIEQWIRTLDRDLLLASLPRMECENACIVDLTAPQAMAEGNSWDYYQFETGKTLGVGEVVLIGNLANYEFSTCDTNQGRLYLLLTYNSEVGQFEPSSLMITPTYSES